MQPTDPNHPRYNTARVLAALKEGTIDEDQVIRACLDYMSEDEVTDMAEINDWFFDDMAGWDESIEEDEAELVDDWSCRNCYLSGLSEAVDVCPVCNTPWNEEELLDD